MKKKKEFSLIQLVPGIFVVLLVFHGITGVSRPQPVSAESTSEDISVETKEPSADITSTPALTPTATPQTEDTDNASSIDLSKIPDGTYYGTGTGYKGKISVSVTMASGKITDITLTEVEADDAAYVEMAKGVISRIIDQQKLDVDVVSGATYSSNGILSAVRNALTGEEDTSVAAAASTGTDSDNSSPSPLSYEEPAAAYKDGTYYGTGTGFNNGEIKVKVVISGGKITSIEVVSSTGQDASYLNQAKGVINAIIAAQSTNVDAISGATYSSNGIISAVRNALAQAATSGSSDSGNSSSNSSSNNNSGTVDVVIDEENDEPATYKDGTYTGSGTGFNKTTRIEVSVKISGGKIISIDITSHKETASYFKKAQTILQDILDKQSTNVDVVSGATLSSNGIIEAVNNALKKAVATATPTPTATVTPTATPTPTPSATPTPAPGEDDSAGVVYIGRATCEPDKWNDFDPYVLTLEVTVTNGTVTAIGNAVGDRTSTEYYEDLNDDYIQFASDSLIPRLLSGTWDESVDIVSGATCSSKAIFAAYHHALTQAGLE